MTSSTRSAAAAKPQAAITVADLQKSFGDKQVLNDVSFTVKPGIVFALLGKNGAGKTTCINILTTLLKQDAGSAEIFGIDVSDASAVKKLFNVTGQFAAVDDGLTVEENIKLICDLYRVPQRKERIDKILQEYDLEQYRKKYAGELSGGFRRRLDIAMSLVTDPKVLFLDEPTTGLDPASTRAVWERIRQLREQGTTIILTTQYLYEAEQLADQVAILHQGTIIANDSQQNLKKAAHSSTVRFVAADQAAFETLLQAVDAPEQAIDEKSRTITWTVDSTLDKLPKMLGKIPMQLKDVVQVYVEEPKLEDIFIQLTDEREHDAS